MAEKKKPQKKKGGLDHLFFTKLIEKFVDLIRKLLKPQLLEFCIHWLTKLANFAIFLAAVLAVLFGIIGAIRLESFTFFIYSLAFAVGILIVQYIAKKFLYAGDTLVDNNPSSLSSSAFLDSVGLLAAIAGVGGFLYYVYEAIRVPALMPLLVGLAAFILFEFVALVALNPKIVAVDVVK